MVEKVIEIDKLNTPPEVAYAFDRMVFDIKEPARHLWTGEQLRQVVENSWKGDLAVTLDYTLLPQNSVVNWMRSSGLPESRQQVIFDYYRDASLTTANAINLTLQDDGDILVDRPFAYVIAIKD